MSVIFHCCWLLLLLCSFVDDSTVSTQSRTPVTHPIQTLSLPPPTIHYATTVRHLPQFPQRTLHRIPSQSVAHQRQWTQHCLRQLWTRLSLGLHPALVEDPFRLSALQQGMGLCQGAYTLGCYGLNFCPRDLHTSLSIYLSLLCPDRAHSGIRTAGDLIVLYLVWKTAIYRNGRRNEGESTNVRLSFFRTYFGKAFQFQFQFQFKAASSSYLSIY